MPFAEEDFLSKVIVIQYLIISFHILRYVPYHVPYHYGVIDIRVWQLLFAINSVRKNPKGIGFTFKYWYRHLCKLRYHAKELGVSARAVERTLFYYHREIQEGLLYEDK